MHISKFKLLKSSKNNDYYWHLQAANGEIILQSEGYKTKQGAENGIESVRMNAPHDERYERLDAKSGEFYFVLKAKNGQVIGSSETYPTKQAREVGIAAVKREAPDAPVQDLTDLIEEAKTVSTTESAGGLVILPKLGHGYGNGHGLPVKPKGGYYGDF